MNISYKNNKLHAIWINYIHDFDTKDLVGTTYNEVCDTKCLTMY